MEHTSDIIVVGGGPCGSFTALNLAKRGASVTVLEEHNEIGTPTHCAGHVSIEGLKRLGLYSLNDKIIENLFCGATFHSPFGKTFSIRFPSPVTCTINRALFDKRLAGLAQAGRVRYRMSTYVESLIIRDGIVKGVKARQDNKTEEFRAKIVVDAEGISSRLVKQAGLRALDCRWLINGVEAEVECRKDVSSDTVDVIFGKNYAPSFYAWVIPQEGNTAKIGLGTKTKNQKELLRKLLFEHPAVSSKLEGAKVLHTAYHPISLGGPIRKAVSNGFLIVGDAASHVKPTTGGGIIIGLTSAKIAADVITKALQENDFSAKCLVLYQRLCQKAFGLDMKVMFEMRKVFEAMSDKKIDAIINFCTRSGLDKDLRSFGDIDFQGQSLIQALRNPRVMMAIVYFLHAYLSANPLKY